MPTDSYLLRTLRDFTLPDEVWFEHLHTVTIRGEPWTCASDHAWVVAAQGAVTEAKHVITDTRRDLVERLLTAKMPPSHYEIQTEDLKRWTGPAPESFDPETILPGRIFDMVVNRLRLAYLLARAPFARVTLWNATSEVGMPCLGLAARRYWLALLSGVVEYDESAEIPVFNLEDPQGECAGFEAAIGLAQE